MNLLSPRHIDRVYRAVEELQLHPDWVVVPLDAAEEGKEILMPDGKLLLRPPGGERFEAWLLGLRGRLSELELSRIPRRGEVDPKRFLTGLWGPRSCGTLRYLPPSLCRAV